MVPNRLPTLSFHHVTIVLSVFTCMNLDMVGNCNMTGNSSFTCPSLLVSISAIDVSVVLKIFGRDIFNVHITS